MLGRAASGMAQSNNARPISIALCCGVSVGVFGGYWNYARAKQFRKIHAYAPAVAAAQLQEHDVWTQATAASTPKWKKLYGTLDGEGRFARVYLTTNTAHYRALVLMGSRFVESELRLRAEEEQYKELVEYEKGGSFWTLLIKPHLMKLMVKRRLARVQAAAGSHQRYAPAFPGDTSHWEVTNITVVLQPRCPWYGKLRRLCRRLLLGQEAIAHKDRRDTVMFSVRGAPLEHPGMEAYLNPLAVEVTSRSKRTMRPILWAALLVLSLYGRKKYRAWTLVRGARRTTTTATATTTTTAELRQALGRLPKLRGASPLFRVVSILRENDSETYVNGKALVESMKDPSSVRTLSFIASRPDTTKPFTIHSWTLR